MKISSCDDVPNRCWFYLKPFIGGSNEILTADKKMETKGRGVCTCCDQILQLLDDSSWHSVEEIENTISLPAEKSIFVLDFLVNSDFIEFSGMEKSKVKITDTGRELIKLPG